MFFAYSTFHLSDKDELFLAERRLKQKFDCRTFNSELFHSGVTPFTSATVLNGFFFPYCMFSSCGCIFHCIVRMHYRREPCPNLFKNNSKPSARKASRCVLFQTQKHFHYELKWRNLSWSHSCKSILTAHGLTRWHIRTKGPHIEHEHKLQDK